MDPSKTLLNPTYSDPNVRFSEKILIKAFGKIQGGRLNLILPSGQCFLTGNAVGKHNREQADLRIVDPAVPRRLLLGGGMALAETYMEGGWETDDLSAVLRILARSRREMGRIARGASRMLHAMDHAAHLLRQNTLDIAKENIQAHYDLSNDLYALFLDPTLTYSAGIFTSEQEPLETAQLRKMDRLIDQMNPKPGDHVLEVGSGWGACAIRLAQTRGCQVTSLTLSEEQALEARRRVDAAGVGHLVEIRLQDYRETAGIFDHIISVEMIEAVGHEFLPVYFQTLQGRLRPGGRMVLQAITIPDNRYREYNKTSDFIRKHVFPGGHLPCPGLLDDLVHQHTNWQTADMFEFGRDYAETLRRWRDAFLARIQDVKALGFDEAFLRKWHYYFAYCEAGFDTDLIHVRQYCFQKPAHSA